MFTIVDFILGFIAFVLVNRYVDGGWFKSKARLAFQICTFVILLVWLRYVWSYILS